MDKEAVLFTKPEELIEYLDENDLLMDLSSKDSEILLNYMEGHGYGLGELDGKLVRVDIGEEHGEVMEYSIDDAIDVVCEWNYVIFSVNFINYCLYKIRIEKGVGLMSEMLEGIKVLLWNRYGKQMYLVKTTKHKLPEILDIIAYIQGINNEICSSFELSVIDICKILVDCFGFEMQNTNFYEMNHEQIRQMLGTVKRLKYHSMSKKSREGVFLIELADFWELYDGQMVSRETIDHSEISKIIKAMVRDNPNARPWLL